MNKNLEYIRILKEMNAAKRSYDCFTVNDILDKVESELERLETMDKALCNGEVLISKGNQLYSAKVNDAFKDCASVKVKKEHFK